MRRTSLILGIALTLTALTFAYTPSPAQRPQRAHAAKTQSAFIQKEVSTQQRINRYFHDDVMPKLESCWGSLRSKGTITAKYTYVKTGARWMFNRVVSEESTLPLAQVTHALKCMTNAGRDTSFAVEGSDSNSDDFVLTWTWPVPFPANAAQLAAAMFAARANSSGAGGGCDGRGAPARCFNCYNLACYKTCVGYDKCTVKFDGNGKATACSNTISCASGGPFGVSNSRVIY